MRKQAKLKVVFPSNKKIWETGGKVDFDNYLTISQQNIANELDMKQSNVSRAIKGLCEHDIIIEGPRAGLNKTYRLNPYIAHKGKNRDKTIIDFETVADRK